VIYDDLVAETLIEPLPEQRTEEPPPAAGELEEPPAVHDAMACDVCKAWLAHVREAEAS
jgi:hypothetical protein